MCHFIALLLLGVLPLSRFSPLSFSLSQQETTSKNRVPVWPVRCTYTSASLDNATFFPFSSSSPSHVSPSAVVVGAPGLHYTPHQALAQVSSTSLGSASSAAPPYAFFPSSAPYSPSLSASSNFSNYYYPVATNMFSQQQNGNQAGAAAAANAFNAFASGTHSAPSTILPVVPSAPLEGLFGDFPADTQTFFPEHMMSESSAEDDMTLGPESDSIDQSQAVPPAHSTDGSTSSTSNSPQPLTTHAADATNGSGLTPPSAFPSHSLPGLLPQHGLSTPTSYLDSLRLPYDHLPTPSMRVKRSAPDVSDAALERSVPLSPLQPSPLSPMPSAASQIGISIGSVAANRRRLSVTRAAAEAGHGPVAGGPASEGYYYRSRDKTNYNQAHKGTLPSPPSTPDSQKRIRCTWNLEETRVLYDLLKDVLGADNFPDVQQIRAHLMRMDPQCTKTLDHVRNKKANLIQKAHSKNVSVGEILIADMHKLEMEAAGAARGGGGGGGSGQAMMATSSSAGGQLISASSTSSFSSTTPASSLAGHMVSGTMTLADASGATSSSSRTSSASSMHHLMGGGGGGAPAAGHVHHPHHAGSRGASSSSSAKGANVRSAARRRLSKRAINPTMLSNLMQPSQTSTAQQLAKVAAAAAAAAAAVGVSPAAQTSTSNAASPASSGSSSSPSIITTSMANVNGGSSATGNGIISSSSGINPSIAPDTSYDPGMLSKSYYMSPQITETQRLQRWYYDSLSRLYTSENEVRARVGLSSIEMSPPPVPVINSVPQKLPPHSQWITTWNVSDSLDSETESSDEHSSGTLIDPTRSTGSNSW